jgi:F0F1-type ATP synthase membrane subunit b/b'
MCHNLQNLSFLDIINLALFFIEIYYAIHCAAANSNLKEKQQLIADGNILAQDKNQWQAL